MKAIDSFSLFATADLPQRWVGGYGSNGGTLAIQNSVLPPYSQPGAQALAIYGLSSPPNGYVLSNNYGSTARFIAGVRHYRLNGSPGTNNNGVVMGYFGSQGAPCCYLFVDNSGSYICNAAGYNANQGFPSPSQILATGPVVSPNAWHYYELDVTFGNASNASVAFYLDSKLVASATNVSVGTATAYQMSLGYDNFGTGVQNQQVNCSQGYYADFYLLDGTGTAPFNAPLGDRKVGFAVLNGPGQVTQWTPTGAAANWQCVNQIPQDGDTTYVSTATVGQEGAYTLTAIPALQTITGVQLSVYGRKDDAGTRTIRTGFGNGTTRVYSGTNDYLAQSYGYFMDEYPLNPITGVAWAVTDLNTLQICQKLTQ